MKLFLKISLFIFAMITTVGDATSSTVDNYSPFLHDGNGNLVFDINGDLEYILFSEGRILPNGNTFDFEYHLKDHLGSVRVAFTPTTNANTVVQENAYYPFGATIADLSYDVPLSTNRYKREGKEYISDLALLNSYRFFIFAGKKSYGMSQMWQ